MFAHQIWTLFAAVAVHKLIMAFTSGLRFAESLPSMLHAVLYVCAFAAMSPIGIGIGLAVTETGQHGLSTDAASSVLQGLATGTFIYVTFFEVFQEQMAHDKRSRDGMLKMLSILVGFTCITILEICTQGIGQ